MHDQPRLKTFAESDFFDNHSAARPLPSFTVARGQLDADVAMVTGREPSGDWVVDLPVAVDETLLERGQQRFNVFCAPCHDRTGSGQGMIVLRGFTPPPSYHTERLRGMPVGYFYDVISNGFGSMSGYKAQVKRADRWAIAAWIRVLQASQATPTSTLSAEDMGRVESGERIDHSGSESGGHGASEDHGDGSHGG